VKQLFREYLTYTSGERSGVVALLAVIAMLLVFLAFSKRFLPSERADFTAFEKEVEALHARVESEAHAENAPFHSKPGEKRIERFSFDPNTASAADLERLGLSPKQANAVVTYVSKGGKFRSKEDFKKLRIIPPRLHEALDPYIAIPEKELKPAQGNGTAHAPALIEVNTADSLELLAIDGVGPVFASRIMKFRKALGGFISKEQLREVRGMTDEKYAFLAGKVSIDTLAVSRINLNTCTVDELRKHPYINYNVARALVNYRTMHGNYRKTEDIRGSDLVDDELYRKIAPYLTVE
jgi:competence protein ComEA